MSSPSVEGTDSGGVEGLAVGAQGNFALLGGQLADGDRVVHSFHLTDEGGDILQILLCGLEIGDESQGDIGEGQRAPWASSISCTGAPPAASA